MTMKATQIRKQRDAKVEAHLVQYAPVWLVDEQILEDRDTVLFNVVFQHPAYGWVSRRYRYDAFNDVLHQRGQRTVEHAQLLAVQETDPYINIVQSNIANAYGG